MAREKGSHPRDEMDVGEDRLVLAQTQPEMDGLVSVTIIDWMLEVSLEAVSNIVGMRIPSRTSLFLTREFGARPPQ